MKSFAFFILVFLTSIVKGQNQPSPDYSTSPVVLETGKRLFQEHCSACHNFIQKGIGPGLQRATRDVPKDWLTKFIINAPEMVAANDERAVRLVKEYEQIMPPFPSLTSGDVEAILAFIHQNQNDLVYDQQTSETSIPDPIPAKIPLTGGSLYVTHHSTAPATGTTAPLARINKMGTLKNRLFIIDLQGILYEIKEKDWLTAMDIRQHRPDFTPIPGLGTGFGSFAFHPEFDENGLLYTTHAEKDTPRPGDIRMPDSVEVGLQWVLMEWKIKDPDVLPFSVAGREVVRIDLLTPYHGVQEIAFNPYAKKGDNEFGLLYVCIGDGGSGERRELHVLCSSNKGVAGSILRIDPLGHNSRNGQYGIPQNNPYATDEDPQVCKEIFARGFRNPNRISWTPDGRMLICDIGQSNIEEINLGIPGADYGWPQREGTFRVDPMANIRVVYPLPPDEVPGKYTYPVLQYDHDEGKAISGGFVYNGRSARKLKGKYVFADINNGRFFITGSKFLKKGQMAPIEELKIWVDNRLTSFKEINHPAKPDSRLGLGPDGELYIFTKADGKLYKVIGYRREK